jgi:hypothetical protein
MGRTVGAVSLVRQRGADLVRVRLGVDSAPALHAPGIADRVVIYVVAALVLWLSINPVRNMLSRFQIMNTSFNPLHLVARDVPEKAQNLVLRMTSKALKKVAEAALLA